MASRPELSDLPQVARDAAAGFNLQIFKMTGGRELAASAVAGMQTSVIAQDGLHHGAATTGQGEAMGKSDSPKL